MALQTKYLFMASMDVAPEKESLFNEVYNKEHVPNLLKVPGVMSVTRLTQEQLVLSIGGEQKEIIAEASQNIRPSMKSRARTFSPVRDGPMRWKRAAGRKRCVHIPATGDTFSVR